MTSHINQRSPPTSAQKLPVYTKATVYASQGLLCGPRGPPVMAGGLPIFAVS